MATPLTDAIKMAVQGELPPSASEIDGREFYVRSVKNKSLLEGDETSYFRHVHIGKDDRVFYSIKVIARRQYIAKLTRIQFRGPFVKNGFWLFGDGGVDVTGAVEVLAAAGGLATRFPPPWVPFLFAIAEVQAGGFVDGNWLPAAAKVADMIGREMAQDI